jgi:hypothetical protein
MTEGGDAIARLVPTLCSGSTGSTAGLTPTDYFVLSRVDGRSTVRMLSQVVGMPIEQVLEVLRRLRSAGLVRLPAEADPVAPTPPPTKVRPAAASPGASASAHVSANAEAKPRPKRDVDLRVTSWPVSFEAFRSTTPLPDEEVDGMTEDQQYLILYYHAHLRRVSYYDLFGVPTDAPRDEIRQAYFRLSRAFHPDRWFRKSIGGYTERLHAIFKWLSRADSVLSNERRRRGYDVLLRRGYLGEWQIEEPDAAPSPAAPTVAPAVVAPREPSETGGRGSLSMLQARARRAEAAGEWEEAVDLYLRAVQLGPTTSLRIRLIECMLKAQSKPEEMDREVRAARAEDAADVELLLLEAEIARRLGDVERATRCYHAVLQVQPSHPVARLGLDRLRDSSP